MNIFFIGNERQREIAKYLQERKATTEKTLAEHFKVTDRTIRTDLKALRRILPIDVRPGRYDGGVYWVGLEDELVEFR